MEIVLTKSAEFDAIVAEENEPNAGDFGEYYGAHAPKMRCSACSHRIVTALLLPIVLWEPYTLLCNCGDVRQRLRLREGTDAVTMFTEVLLCVRDILGHLCIGVRVCTHSRVHHEPCPLRLCCAMSAEDPSNDNERQVTYTD